MGFFRERGYIMDEYIILSYTTRVYKSELSIINAGCEDYEEVHKNKIWTQLKSRVNNDTGTYNIGCIDLRVMNETIDMDMKWTAINVVTEEYNEDYFDIRCPGCEKEVDILHNTFTSCCVCKVPHFCHDCIKKCRVCHGKDCKKDKHNICKTCLKEKVDEMKAEHDKSNAIMRVLQVPLSVTD